MLLVIATNVLGNVSLSRGMHQVGLVIWMLSDLALLSRADLSFVLPVTASAYVLVALGGHFLLRDHISWERWTGIVLITVGVILAEETPARTTKGPPESLL